MQGIQSVAAGLLALLSSAALAAELPVVKQVESSRRGCVYTFKVLDDSASGYGYPSGPSPSTEGKYKLVVEVKSTSFMCVATPRSVEIARDFEVPDLAIQAGGEGLAVAYTRGAYHLWTGLMRALEVRRLDPANLGVMKADSFLAMFDPKIPMDGPYAPGQLSVSGLTIYSRSIEVTGSLVGNTVWNSVTRQSGTGERYVISFLDFFGQPQQAPSIVIY